MKKTSVIIFLLMAAFQLKAQQNFIFKPLDSLSTSTGNYFKFKLMPGLQFTSPGFDLKQNSILAGNNNFFLNNLIAYDNMPITLFVGRDDMPIVKLRGYGRMPVLDLKNCTPVDGYQNVLKGVPTFLTPGGQN